MRYIKPDYYDNFKCVADKCPDTCCAGWQIMIDEESLEKYGEVKGQFGRRLVNSIDWQEGCFYQTDKRCAFLNDSNLCDIYTALGCHALCNTCKEKEEHFSHRRTMLQHMFRLERLREDWTGRLTELEASLYKEGAAHYEECVEKFHAFLQENEVAAKQWENIGEQLFVFFLYTYFCGAVYDDWIYSKMALAAETVRFIRELYLTRWLQNGTLSWDDYIELAYRYAREIEHSDQNLNALEEIFMDNYESV